MPKSRRQRRTANASAARWTPYSTSQSEGTEGMDVTVSPAPVSETSTRSSNSPPSSPNSSLSHTTARQSFSPGFADVSSSTSPSFLSSLTPSPPSSSLSPSPSSSPSPTSPHLSSTCSSSLSSACSSLPLLSSLSLSPADRSLSPSLGPSDTALISSGPSLSPPDPCRSSTPLVSPTFSPSLATVTKIREVIEQLGFSHDLDTLILTDCSTEMGVTVPPDSTPPSIANQKAKSWLLNYSVLSFLMNGQLFAEYHRISNMLGLPPCSNSQWQRIVQWLEEHVTQLAEWSCEQVREQVKERGDQEAWVASFDGYYQTRGHHSNNSSATLHDYTTGNIAWFTHRTKRGVGHNWEGTSSGAEADMYDEILSTVKKAGFNIAEMVTDKDSSMNAIYCRYFPEGNITYCSNHSAKTFHKDLVKVKQMKCQCKAEGLPRCKRMPDAFINSCKTSLKNLICGDRVFQSDDPYKAFSAGVQNFYSHYCLDDHSSSWCYHKKEESGKPYVVKNRFTCRAQTEGFRNLLHTMSEHPQDYITPSGRMTTNTVEGFHGLSLMYRDKRTDLGHQHYICKNNMGMCHKNLGPVWKVLCCARMGVPIPSVAASAIIKEQQEWESKRRKRTEKEYIRKRCTQKRAKTARHEKEKEYMEALHALGHAVGEYVGGGQGDTSPAEDDRVDDADADAETEFPGCEDMDEDTSPDANDHHEEQEDSSDHAHPLMFFFDCEATGFSIYDDHITEIAAKVVGMPLSSVSQPTFSSLVHTPRYIPKKVAEKTGITAALLRPERPLSAVFPAFLQWIVITTQEVSENSNASHYPVLVAHNGFRFDFPILLAEIERRPSKLSTSHLMSHQLHFSDTLPHLRQVQHRMLETPKLTGISLTYPPQTKKDGHHALKGVRSFGLEALYSHYCPERTYPAHRALPDVEAMVELVSQTALVDLLSSLPAQTAKQQLLLWRNQKEERGRTCALLQSLGKRVTVAQAKRLDALHLSHPVLREIRSTCASSEEFQTILRQRGVRSKPLRQKLANIVPP